MSEEDYDGEDAAPCSFCGETFSTEASPCLTKAHARISELEAALAEREREIERLRAWKESATEVESEWDAQAIARMLGGIAGDSCRRVVAEKVPRLLSELASLRAQLAAAEERVAKAEHDLEVKELAVQDKTCSECQRECEIENRILEGKLAALRARDEGRVERVADALSIIEFGDVTSHEKLREDHLRKARAVLKAADGREP
jgi:hypothetical protein